MKDSDISAIASWLGQGSINIFGRQFAGKDTQGAILRDTFNGELLGGGDIMRNSTIPPHVAAEMKAGKLATTADYIAIVLPFLRQESLVHKPLILSAVGRWIGEEVGVLQATAEAGHPIKAVIHINLSKEDSIARWKSTDHRANRGERNDDTEEGLLTRLDEFEHKTLPVLEEYRKRGLLIEVDGNQPVEVVTEEIIEALASRASTSP